MKHDWKKLEFKKIKLASLYREEKNSTDAMTIGSFVETLWHFGAMCVEVYTSITKVWWKQEISFLPNSCYVYIAISRYANLCRVKAFNHAK